MSCSERENRGKIWESWPESGNFGRGALASVSARQRQGWVGESKPRRLRRHRHRWRARHAWRRRRRRTVGGKRWRRRGSSERGDARPRGRSSGSGARTPLHFVVHGGGRPRARDDRRRPGHDLRHAVPDQVLVPGHRERTGCDHRVEGHQQGKHGRARARARERLLRGR